MCIWDTLGAPDLWPDLGMGCLCRRDLPSRGAVTVVDGSGWTQRRLSGGCRLWPRLQYIEDCCCPWVAALPSLQPQPCSKKVRFECIDAHPRQALQCWRQAAHHTAHSFDSPTMGSTCLLMLSSSPQIRSCSHSARPASQFCTRRAAPAQRGQVLLRLWAGGP